MKCEKIWEDRGIICFILHNSIFDTFNGYIVIPTHHPWHGKDPYNIQQVKVHGGITFSKVLCGVWVIGFDTNHSGDAFGHNADTKIKRLFSSNQSDKIYKNKEFVVNEIENLVTQALNICERKKLYNKDSDLIMAKLLLGIESQ